MKISSNSETIFFLGVKGLRIENLDSDPTRITDILSFNMSENVHKMLENALK